MSKTNKGKKRPGSEFWSKRPGKMLSGTVGKKITKARERMAKKELIQKVLKEV